MQRTILLEDLNPLDLNAMLADNSANAPTNVCKLDVQIVGNKFYNIVKDEPRKLRYPDVGKQSKQSWGR